MSANSIFSALTSETTVAEIRLLLSADRAKKRTIMLLEGEDDVRAFKFLVSSDVVLIKAYGASTTVDKLMPEYFPHEKRVIGVRDRDYQVKKRFERIFYCDYCCCEMMLISDDETFERVTENFYKGKLSAHSLREEILRKLSFVSVIRKTSARRGWGLKISDTDLSRIISPDIEPQRKQVIAFINSYNSRLKITPAMEKELSRCRVGGSLEDYLKITNGHDFLEVMRIYCTYGASNGTRRSVNERALGGALRCAYSREAFSKTRLFSELREYGAGNGLVIVRE